MENEDEEASKLTNPRAQVEDNSMNVTTATTITTAATATESHEAVQEKSEPQCEPETVTELSESPLPPKEQSLGEGKEIEEEEIVGNREAVAEVDESNLGGEGYESRDSELVVSKAVGEEDGDVANAEDVVNGGDLVVLAAVVGSEGEKEDVIGEGEREMAAGVEEAEGQTRVDDLAEEKEEKADVSEEKEIVGEQKGDDVVVEPQTESETKVDDVAEVKEILDEQKGDVAIESSQIENETVVDDVAKETCIVEDMMDERTEMAGDREVADDTKVIDVVEETETAYETKAVGVADETETEDKTKAVDETETEDETKAVDETKVVDVADETETADETKAVDMAEETETVDETKVFDVAVEMDGRAEMAEDSEIASESKVVDVAEDKEMVKGINFASAEVTKVADVTAEEMEVGNVAEEMVMQKEEKEFTDMPGGETEVEEGMEKASEETELLEATETEEMEMGDAGEETMEPGADVGDETEKAGTAEEMERGEDVEKVSKTVGGKRKRVGKNSKSSGKAPSRKKSEEDVCFICFDGGDLVLCDRR